VLVTRPQPGASATAERLSAMGFEPVVLPLTRVVPVPLPDVPNASAFDGVAITSANAARHLPSGLAEALASLPVFAVGERTADAAREAGMGDVKVSGGDGTALARLVVDELGEGRRLLYLAGRERRPEFERELAHRSFRVTTVETYATEDIEPSAAVRGQLVAGGAPWAATVFSPRGGTVLSALLQRPELGTIRRETQFFCISDRAAAPLRAFAADRIRISETPDEEGILRLLSQQG